MTTRDAPTLFRFEVPTSRGVFVIIGPDTLPPDEAVRIGEEIARLIPLLVLEPEIGVSRPDSAAAWLLRGLAAL